MRKFGELFFEYVAEFNFDKTSELAEIFDKTGDVKRILKELELFTSVPIIPGNRFNPAARIRFSANNLSQRDGLINIPVSMVDWVKRIFEIGSNQGSIQKTH